MDWLKDLIQKATQVITTPVNIAKQSLQQQGITTPKQFFDKAIVGGLKQFPSFIDKSLSSTVGKIPFIGNLTSSIVGEGTKTIYKGLEGFGEGYTGGLVDIPYPKSTSIPQKLGYGAGYLAGTFTGLPSKLAKLIAPTLSPATKPITEKGLELMSKGGIKSAVGRGLVNVAEGMPYTPVFAGLGKAREIIKGEKPDIKSVPKEMVGSTLFDVGLGAMPFGAVFLSTKPAIKQIKNVDELASVVSKEFKVGAGEGLTKGLDEVISSLKSKGYKIADELVNKINKGGVLFGKNFSLSVGKPLGQGKAIVDFIFEEGYKPIKQAIEKVKGAKLKPSETSKNLIEETISKTTSAKLEKPISTGVKIKPPEKPVEIKGLLPGETKPLTPKQAVSIYKKTGGAYPFKNVLKQADEVIQLPEKSSMLESMVQRKGEIFSADDINPNAKDLSDGLLGNIKEAANSVRRMFEGLGEKARKFVVDFHAQKIAEAKSFLDEKVKELQKVFDDMGIKGKKQEELLFDYAEGKIPKEQAPENIVIAGQKLRQFYDDLLNKINEKRALVGADPIARRENYVTHIFELTNETKKLMEIDPFSKEVVGDVPFFKFGKRRTTESGYEKDLTKAIRAYVRAAEYQIAMPEVINRWKIMGEALQKKGLTNFANYVARLTEYIQKGATPMVLKMNEQPLLRNLNQVAEIVSSRISKNLISQNISASFSNPTQIVTNLASQVGLDNVVKGFVKTIKEGDDLTSVFIRNRRDITQLNEGGIEKLMKKLDIFRIMTEFSDRWAYNSALEWALSQGKRLDEAKEIADNMAAKTIGERVFGLVPEYQRYSGVFRLLTMFTLEPINAIYSFFKDIPQTSKNAFDLAVKMGMALVMANLYNHLTERTIGRRFAFDPIDMAVRSIDIWVNKPYTTGEKIKETGKTITRNIPLLDVAFGKGAGFLPVSAPIPTTQELTEDLPMAVAKAGLLLANPYGGGYQIYKTLEGLRAYQKGAVETPKGEIKYLVEKDLDDFLKTTLFGKASIPQAREFYEEKRKPLSPQQSMAVKSLESDEDRQKLYDALMYYRAVNGELSTIKTKISEALYLGKKTPQEIKKMANDLYNQAKKNLAYYTDYYKQKKGVYKRVLDFFAKIIKRDTEETPTAKKETPKTTALPEFQGVDLSKILGALGSTPAWTRGVRLSSKSAPKINLPKVSWGKALPKASSKRGGVNLKPVSTTYSRGKEANKDYTTRRVGRGVRIRKG